MTDKYIIIIALFVDDILFLWNHKETRDKIKTVLMQTYKIKDLGEVRHYLGMKITRDVKCGEIRVSQEQYIQNLLDNFNMFDCKIALSPLEVQPKKYIPTGENENKIIDVPYQNLIGALMYAVVSTRVDLAYPVSYLSQFNKRPNEAHWKSAKRILRYLKATKDYCLVFKKENQGITGYVDSDWALGW